MAAAAIFEVLVRWALSSFLLLGVAGAAVLLVRQPARRIRVIEWTLVALVLLPCLLLVPGYPRLAVWPATNTSPVAASQDGSRAAIPPAQSFEQAVGSEPAFDAPQSPVAPADELLPPAAIEDEPPALADAIESQPAAEPPPMTLPEESNPLDTLATAPVEAAPPLVIVSENPRDAFDASHAIGWPRDYRAWVLTAYAVGVLVMAAWSLVGVSAVRRLLRTAQSADEACRALLREIGGPAADRVRLVVSRRIGQPCAFAWRGATIVLPESLVEGGDHQALRWALAHEWSHVARGDLVSWTASGVVRWFYFYQPALWWLRGQLQLCQDFVADDQAARAGTTPEDYAEFLTISSFTRPTLAAGLGIGGRISDLRRRIVMLVDPRQPFESHSPRRWNLTVMAAACLLIGVTAGLGPQENRLEAGGGRLQEDSQAPADDAAFAEPEASDAEAPIAEESPSNESEDPFAVKPAATEPVAPLVGPQPAEPPRDDAAVPAVSEPVGPIESAPPVAKPTAKVKATKPIGPAQPAAKARLAPATVPAEPPPFGDDSVPIPDTPRGPRTIKPGDLLTLDVMDNLDSLGVKGLRLLLQPGTTLLVDNDGSVSLGSRYGSVSVGGKTLHQAEQKVGDTLLELIRLNWEAVEKHESEERLLKRVLSNMQINVRLQFVDSKRSTAGAVAVPVVASPTSAGKQMTGLATLGKALLDGRRVKPGDVLEIDTVDMAANLKPRPVSQVEPDGSLPLGAQYGRIKVAGMTIVEVEKAVVERMASKIQKPQVQVTFADPARAGAASRSAKSDYQALVDLVPNSREPARSTHGVAESFIVTDDRIQPGDTLSIEADPNPPDAHVREVSVVEPDGSLALGVQYGRVKVAGKTITDAEAAITEKLAQVLQNPQVQVTTVSRAGLPTPDAAARIQAMQDEIEALKATIKRLEAGRDAEYGRKVDKPR